VTVETQCQSEIMIITTRACLVCSIIVYYSIMQQSVVLLFVLPLRNRKLSTALKQSHHSSPSKHREKAEKGT
jgi:hypothetical protein